MQRRKKLQVKNRKQTDMQSRFDVLGSYTGVESFDKYEKPVQDADDLWYHLKLNPEQRAADNEIIRRSLLIIFIIYFYYSRRLKPFSAVFQFFPFFTP